MTTSDKLNELKGAIRAGTIEVTFLTGMDSRICPSCNSGNAMIRQGECPEGYEPHHFWKIELDLKACRDCGHSVVAPLETQAFLDRGETWELPAND